MIRTMQISLPQSDANFLRKLSANMGWTLTPVPMKKGVRTKVEMTEEEFRAKIEKSSAQVASGDVIAMQPEETGEQFINRLLCMSFNGTLQNRKCK